MRYGIEITNLGDYADPRAVVRLARRAEAFGWEGLFVWDHLGFVWGVPSGDPWIILAAVAASTTRLRLGPAVTPLPRRRVQVVANELATLDHLSGGRAVFGAGIGGVPEEFTAFGEPGGAAERAGMLDEGLALLDRLLLGEEVTHHGTNYTLGGVKLAPLQRPPIWIGGESGPALRRAARWGGWIGNAANPDGTMGKSPERIAEMVEEIRRYRKATTPFEVAVGGYSGPGDTTLPRAYEEGGATWWLESIHEMRGPPDEMMARVEAGPPGEG